MRTLILAALAVMTLASWAGSPRSVGEKKPEVNITSFGAVGDGHTLCTEAFARAMRQLAAEGGGRLTVPAGTWLTGPIQFESGVELHVERGALVLFTTDYDAYPEVRTVYEGITKTKRMSPLWAYEKRDVSITGPGTFDGQGQAWRPVKQMKLTESAWSALTKGDGIALDGIWYPNAKPDALAGTAGRPDQRRVLQRPTLLEFTRCTNVTLREATFSNSPAWNVHPLMCDTLVIENVNIRNPWFSQNGDGLDLEACSNAVIRNSTFDVGDDAICMKAGKDAEGRSWKRPCHNVVIEGCTVYHGHGGFVVGSEMSGGVKDIVVRNCTFIGTDTGLRFKSLRGRGGVVENILIDNVRMIDIPGDAFTFDLYYGANPSSGSQLPVVSEETPSFRNIVVRNVTCRGAGRAIYFNGLPEMPIYNVTLSNSTFSSRLGAELHYARDIVFENVKIQNTEGPRVTQTDVTRFTDK